MSDIEIAKKLLDQQGEINRLKAKLHRVREFCEPYSICDHVNELRLGVIDIIDNAYEKGTQA
jgi:hypothetical protein